ncbi:MAG: hypothetical protein KA715_04375 [Xanthomonadaceae bacterium]|nr:hypothetical protein [Xanthomonadaceae bacterium]
MNCFSLRNTLPDLARGGTAPESIAHLQSCPECIKKLSHIKEIRQLIKRLPHHSVLPELKKIALEDTDGIDDEYLENMKEEQRKTRLFDQSPWYVKSGIEALALAVMTIGIIWGIPKVRQLYDRSIQRRLETLDLTDLSVSNTEDTETIAQTTTQVMSDEIKAVANEVWRFNIKTDLLHELQTRLLNAIKSEHSVDNRETVVGTIAPGGVQIDFTASVEFIQQFKGEINAIANKLEQENTLPVSAAVSAKTIKPRNSGLTWYKSKSKTKLPKDRIRIVIWLSQM